MSENESIATESARPMSRVRTIFGIDRRALVFYRVMVGVMLITDLIKRSLAFSEHYTDAGVFPIRLADMDMEVAPAPLHPFRIYMQSGEGWVTALLFGVAALFAVFVAIGYRTRLFAFASLIFVVSIQLRNPHICHTGDALLTVLTLWAVLLPLSSYLSVDNLRRPRREPVPEQVLTPATGCFLLQILFFYLAAGALKHPQEVWTSGEAVTAFVQYQTYTTAIGAWMAPFHGLHKFFTYYTLVLEAIGPFLLFLPWCTRGFRYVMVALFLSFHFGLELMIHIGLLEMLSMIAVACFLPNGFWRAIEHWLSNRAWARTAQRRLRSAMTLVFARGERPTVATPGWQTRLVDVGAVACIAIIAASNLTKIAGQETKLPAPVEERLPTGLVRRLQNVGLLQNWVVFTDLHRRFLGWFLVVGQLDDGSLVDVLNERPFRGLDKPEHFARSYVNHNQRRFWNRITLDEFPGLRQAESDYLIRKWNAEKRRELVRLAMFDIGRFPFTETEDRVRILFAQQKENDQMALMTWTRGIHRQLRRELRESRQQ